MSERDNTCSENRDAPAGHQHDARATATCFTLVEMLIVLVMIAVLTSGVIVSFAGRREMYSLRAAAQDLAPTIRYAATEAKVRNLPHRVAFYDNMRAYRVESITPVTTGDPVPVGGRSGRMRRLRDGVSISAVYPGGERTDPMPKEFDFGPSGSGFRGAIELTDTTGHTVRIEVMCGTGQVHLVE